MENLNWGIMSTASIATKHVIPAIKKAEHNFIGAIASRNKNKAQKTAERFEIKTYYDNYEDLILDPNLDIIYIPLPNTLHKKWVLKTAKAGKNILCEKPLGINAVQVQEMIEQAKKKDIILIEGFMYRYQPFIKKLKELLQLKIGDLRYLDINLSYMSTRPADDIRFNKNMGGGSLYDVGCYTVDLIRYLLGEKPVEVYNLFFKENKNHVDHSGTALLKFAGDITANLRYSFNSFAYKDFTAIGSKGKIIVNDLFEWFPEDERLIEVITKDKYETFSFKSIDPYLLEIEGIYDHIVNGNTLPEDIEASLDNLIIIDHLFKSAEKNVHVKL